MTNVLVYYASKIDSLVPVTITAANPPRLVLLYVHNIIEKVFMDYYSHCAMADQMNLQGVRRMFSLRLQVKVQYKATQRAQINERKTAESKYRLTS